MITCRKHITPAKTSRRQALKKSWGLFLGLYLVFSGLLWAPQPAPAEQNELQEYAVKTAFIYNFAK